MDIFIYSDESGVFDVVHNRYFVFGGLMFLGREARDICARKYSKAENDVRVANNLPRSVEVKASNVSNSSKGKLFRSLNNQIRFGVVIDEKKILKTQIAITSWTLRGKNLGHGWSRRIYP